MYYLHLIWFFSSYVFWEFWLPNPKFRSWKNFNLCEGHCQLSDMARSWKLAFHYLDTWKIRPRINKSLHRLLRFEQWGNVFFFDNLLMYIGCARRDPLDSTVVELSTTPPFLIIYHIFQIQTFKVLQQSFSYKKLFFKQ